MRIPTALLLVLLVSACTQTTSAPEAESAEPAPEPVAEARPAPEQAAPVPLGWAPDEACKFIGNGFGVGVRPYQNDYEDEYSCSTPYKNLQEGAHLPNNLAYYVAGSRDLATEIKLVLNVNEPSKQTYAKEQLAKFSSILAKAATGAGLSPDMSSAIKTGSPKLHEGSGFRQELKRDDWPTGNGYELHYIVTKVGEG